MKKIFKAKFADADWDEFLAHWLGGQISSTVLDEWAHVLMFDSRFREDFCDFVKAMREPGWQARQAKGDPST